MEAIDISGIVSKAARAAETKAKLSPVFLSRESFAANASTIGSLELDRIIGGGIPPSRVIGISGPEHTGKSLIATQIASEQLKAGRVVCYMDAEGGNDPLFLKSRGIDFEKYRGRRNKKGDLIPGERDLIYYYQPTSGEQLVHYMNDVMAALPENRSPTAPPIVFVLDSVVALISGAVTEDIDSNKMAMHAKMYSEIMPIIVAQLNRTGCSFVYTNQLRNKPMQQFGCLQGDTPIQFTDGRVFPIREVVDNKIQGSVWSYSGGGKIVPSKITNWFDNGKATKENWVSITTEGPGSGNGYYSVTVTKSHKVMTHDEKWVEAQEIKEGDFLVTKYIKKVQSKSNLEGFMAGLMVGDVCVPQKQKNTGIMILQNNEQPEYLKWKINKLSPFVEFKEYPDNLFISIPCTEVVHWGSGRRQPIHYLNRMTDLSLAVWYMDDGNIDVSDNRCDRGTISVKRLRNDPQQLDQIVEWFANNGIPASKRKDNTQIVFNKESFYILCSRICKYVPESMSYKLPEEFRGKYQDFDLKTEETIESLPVTVKKVRFGLGHKENRKFDLEIEGHHNYLAGHSRGGLIVHNSPEYEPAGDALKFYSSVRFRLGSSKPKFSIDDKDHPFVDGFIPDVKPKQGGVWQEPVYNIQGEEVGLDKYIYTAVRTIKNKVYNPQKTCWMRVQFESNGATGHGLDPVYDVFTFLLNTKQIEKGKAWKGKDGKWVTDGTKKPKETKDEWVYKLVETEYKLKELGIPEVFNYMEIKSFVEKNKDTVIPAIRQRMLVEGSTLLGSSEETL